MFIVYRKIGKRNMAKSIKNISKTLIIPPGSEEHFISFPRDPTGADWFDQGVALAGFSRLTAGYLVRHSRARYHFGVYCTAGEVRYRSGTAGGVLHRGEFLFIPAAQMQCLSTTEPEFRMFWWLLNPEHPRWNGLRERTSTICRTWRCGNELTVLTEMLYRESQTSSGPVAESFCRLVLDYLEREFSEPEAEREVRQRQQMEQLWNEVRKNLGIPWTVNRLASRMGLSVSHFHAMVMHYYHATPREMIRRFRFDEAKRMLLYGDAKLETIAENTGYSSAFALSRSFRKHLGICPREFRRMPPMSVAE